jgi:23S rRNA (uracil1939-C5)-methyltransferase
MGRFLTVEIEKMVYGGRGMGRAEGKVIFVPFTAPGDRLKVKVIREKKDYAEAEGKSVERKSSLRIQPFCPLFGDCGGCQVQHLAYADQLKLKEEAVRDTLHRLSQTDRFEITPIVPSPEDRGYRIRAQFRTGISGARKFLGFHAWKTHRVVEIQDCPLLHPLANRILQRLQRWIGEHKEISLRSADIQVSPDDNKGVVSLRLEGSLPLQVAEEIRKQVPEVKGIIGEGRQRVYSGDLNLHYNMPGILGEKGLSIRTSGESFFQVNPGQNWNLIQKVVEGAGLGGGERVLDLFCGSGNLTLPLAQRAGQVWGIDQDPKAVAHAAENARRNSLPNCTFITGDAGEGIRRVKQETPFIDVVVLDPPRVGATGILDLLASLHPPKILYVSCEPPTLARDLARLIPLGYNVRRIQPLDMFPQTYHVEVIAEMAADYFKPAHSAEK